MAKVVPFRIPLSAGDFEATVRERAKYSQYVVQTYEFKLRMEERGISFRQVINVMRKSTVASEPKFNSGQSSYEGKMKYHGTGREITVVCAVRKSEVTVIAITAY